jgi:2',3'-cyclic-nucleotide 2'-phosphodiesterase (5'-nucleotidase family)
MLENGVSAMPGVNGKFAQVSGLCFTYDIDGAVGSRVTGAVLANADGSCTATAVDLTAGSSYKIAENDFMVAGGDGYPNFASRATSQGILDQVTADYVAGNSPLHPTIQGRVVCTDSNPVGGNACPVPVP